MSRRLALSPPSLSASAPSVLFLDDLARELRISRRTIERLRRHGAFPIQELPSLDKRPRWSRTALERYHAGERHAGGR